MPVFSILINSTLKLHHYNIGTKSKDSYWFLFFIRFFENIKGSFINLAISIDQDVSFFVLFYCLSLVQIEPNRNSVMQNTALYSQSMNALLLNPFLSLQYFARLWLPITFLIIYLQLKVFDENGLFIRMHKTDVTILHLLLKIGFIPVTTKISFNILLRT